MIRRRRGGRALAPTLAGFLLAGVLLACPASSAAAGAPRLPVAAAALIEEQTGQLLYSANGSARRPVASATKLMSALVVLEHTSPSAVMTHNAFAPPPGSADIGLGAGERMTVGDLLLALLLPSAADAAEDLAFNLGRGSVSRFVALMNAEAVRLRLDGTHFADPSGFDDPGNRSTALDLVRLARYALRREPFLARIVATRSATLRSGSHPREVFNLNDLLGRVRWINGVKTGATLQAGHVLVASGTRSGMTLVGAVLGARSHLAANAAALALLDYGFSQFHLVEPLRAGNVVARLPVRGSPGTTVPVAPASTVTRVLGRTQRVAVRLELPASVRAPGAMGEAVGTAVVSLAGRAVLRVPLVLARALPTAPGNSPLGARRTATLAVLLVLLLALAVSVRRRNRALERASVRPRRR